MSRPASPSSSTNGSASVEQEDAQLPDQPGVSQYFGDSDLDNFDEEDEEDSDDDPDDNDDEKDSQLGSDESETDAPARSKSNQDVDMESARQGPLLLIDHKIVQSSLTANVFTARDAEDPSEDASESSEALVCQRRLYASINFQSL